MRIVHPWLQELVDVPDDIEAVAREISLRGFEVAEVDRHGPGVIDFEITANRPDCLSHLGIAREASTIRGVPLRMPELLHAGEPRTVERVEVRLDDAVLCPRYCAQVFEVSVGPSPAWLGARLQAAGVRPINNIVDVTNYVMLEMGQPMHAFDLDRLTDRTIVIRRARAGERLRSLDGVERELDGDMLVIADATRPVAIGGVMGGADSEVGPATTLVALESAHFHAPSVRRTSKALGLKTEASTRFERGADIAAPPVGLARAAALLARIRGGRPLGPILDRYPAPRERLRVRLRASRIARLLGQDVPAREVPRILEPLGFGVERDGSDELAWTVSVPTFRVDVTREADLIEEVGRHHGFDRLPVTFPVLASPQPAPDVRIGHGQLARKVLTAAGFSEAMTFAFIERDAALPFCAPGAEPAPILNPLSEKFAVLRPSLIPGLLDACSHNRRRERRDVQLFETGSRFTEAGEGRAAGFVWCGAASEPHWSGTARGVDLFDVKGVVEELCAAFGVEPEFEALKTRFLVEGRAAIVRTAGNGCGERLGLLGQIAPPLAGARGLPPHEPVYAAEVDMDLLGRLGDRDDLRVDPLPRFPSIVRDLSALIDEALPAAAVRGTIRSAGPPTLISIVEFDRYQGTGVPEGRVSLSLRLTFRAPDRTLTDAEVDTAMATVVTALGRAHGAERR